MSCLFHFPCLDALNIADNFLGSRKLKICVKNVQLGIMHLNMKNMLLDQFLGDMIYNNHIDTASARRT